MAKKKGPKSITLIASNSKPPALKLKPGKLDVRVVSIVDGSLGKPKKLAARLCGGTSSCYALFDIEAAVSNPAK